MGLLSTTREQMRQLQQELQAHHQQFQSLVQSVPTHALPQALEALESHCEALQRQPPERGTLTAQSLHQLLLAQSQHAGGDH